MVLEILVVVVVVEILDQDQEVTPEEDLMDMEVVVDLGMAIMGMEEGLEVAILKVALVMDEEEEDMVVEDLDMATRVGTTEVVMTTMEEEIMEVEIITSNLLTTKSGNFGGSRNMGDHMVEETMVQEGVGEVGVMEGEANIGLLPIYHGLHCINRRG